MEFGPLLVLALALASIVGLSLGLFGGGGSILMVPLLSYVAGLPAKEAIATSLLVVGATSATSLIPHARKANVRWKQGMVFAATSMLGAFGGGLLASGIPAQLLMLGFAIIMLASARGMIRGRKNTGSATQSLWLSAPVGLGIGMVTGLVGAGGGFLLVPALALLAGLSMQQAVGTSLLVITLNSITGLAGQLNSVALDWPLAAGLATTAILGSLIGARLSRRIDERALRKGFGYFVLAMGVFVLSQELPAPGGLVVVAVAALAGALVLLCNKIPAMGARCPLVLKGETR
ncbi:MULTISPECIES: sulfite exporter TauE/SafE family protein [unclassified Glutamicibacter]|uniref:sulfite exporter TauE/SafE family protein n=1 Tax=unclassified Glutamicibacter TaxID=2627139 RepID=UPI002FC764FE